jgi:hypothetical protein
LTRKELCTPKRREQLNLVDKKRDNTPKRKDDHKVIDKKRNITPKRIYEKKQFEQKRRNTTKRQVYTKDYKTNAFLKSIYTDTGFNVICTSCAEFKSRYSCTKVTVLSETQQQEYLSTKRQLKSKDGKTYLCQTCRSQIVSNKEPKTVENSRNQKFPTFLKNHLKKIVDYVTILKKRKISEETLTEADIDKALQLNKLEAHLLKLVIPFVRIAHCPRGTYVKVNILISSNISHSMSKILSRKQRLLPVYLKRRLEYTGNYLEEVIDRSKVEAYFDFFKRFNPLFNDVQFQQKNLEEYEDECESTTKEFEEAIQNIQTKTIVLKQEELEIGSITSSGTESESEEENLDNNASTYENTKKEVVTDETNLFRDQTTVFCNKYEEDLKVHTVANKLANIIADAEIIYNIEIDDEIENEEMPDSEQEIRRDSNFSENENMFLQDELFNENEIFQSIGKSQAENLMKASRNNINSTLNKIKKIPVAPGEDGKFKNWVKMFS